MNLAQQRKSRLSEIAARQHGYFTAKQAIVAGFSRGNHPSHVHNGDWLRSSYSIYRLPGWDDGMDSWFTFYSLWSRNQDDQPQAVISHHSALAIHGLASFDPQRIHLTVPDSFRKRIPSEVSLHYSALNLSTIENRGAFLVTNLPQTLKDLGMFAAQSFSPELRELAAAPVRTIPSISASEETAALLSAGKIAGEDRKESGFTVEQPLLMRERIFNMICNRTVHPRVCRRSQAGFTLVELLVVTAIISVLAGMLLPVLEKALSTARQAQCASSLRQIGLADSLYRDDWQGWVIPAYYQYDGSRGPGPIKKNTTYWWWPDLFYDLKLLDTPQIFRCPEYKGTYPVVYGINQNTISNGTAYNCYGRAGSGITPLCHDRNMKSPGDTITFADGFWEWAGVFYSPPAYNPDAIVPAFAGKDITDKTGTYIDYDRVVRRHGGGANYLFYDGHVNRLMFTRQRNWTIIAD